MTFHCRDCTEPCCGIRDGETGKTIMIFPEELEPMEQLALDLDLLDFAVVEELVFPDIQNDRILVAAYRLFLERVPTCAFMDPSSGGCLVQARLGVNAKPLVCRAYPLAIKTVDAVSREYFLDTACPEIARDVARYDLLKLCSRVDEVESFLATHLPGELEAARRITRRLAWIPVRLRQLEHEGAATIPESMDAGAWEKALRDWDRVDLVPVDGDG